MKWLNEWIVCLKTCDRLENNAACNFFLTWVFFVFFLILSRSVKFESVTTFVCVKYDLDCWLNKIQDWNKSEHRVQEVRLMFYYVCHIFWCRFWKKNKKWKKLKAWILLNQMHTEKQMRVAALRHTCRIFVVYP